MSLPVGTIFKVELGDGIHGFKGELRIAGYPIYSGNIVLRPVAKVNDKSPDYVVERIDTGAAIATARRHHKAGAKENLQIWLHAFGYPEGNLSAFPPEDEARDDDWRVVYIPPRDGDGR